MMNAVSPTLIDVDQVVRLLEQVLAPKTLKPLQRLIIQASWQGLSYLQMAEVYQYDAGHLRDMGSELWQELSQVLRKRVQKRDLRGIVLQLAKSPFGQGKKDIAWIDSFVDQPFYGRETELQTLYHWLVGRSCRLISLNGLEGSGKTVLAAKAAHQVKNHFEQIVWWNFSSAIPLASALPHWLSSLTQGRIAFLPNTLPEQLLLFFTLLKERRSLLILDGIEELFCPGEYAAKFHPQCEDYGPFLKRITEENHQSCVLILSREQCQKCDLAARHNPFIQRLTLSAIDLFSAKQIFAAQGISLDNKTLNNIHYYQGNPLMLKILATYYQENLGNPIKFSKSELLASYVLCQDILEGLFLRLSPIEKALVYYLAEQSSPITFEVFVQGMISQFSSENLLQALDSLNRRFCLHTIPNSEEQYTYVLPLIWKDFLMNYVIQKYPLITYPSPKIVVGAVVKSSPFIYPAQHLEVIQFSRPQAYEDLNQTYDDIPMGYYSLNSQGKLVYINQSILELLGYDKEELLGRSMADLLVNELKDCFRINYPLFKKRGEIKHQQLLMQHKNGQQVPVMMNAKVIKDEKNKFLMTRTFIMEI